MFQPTTPEILAMNGSAPCHGMPHGTNYMTAAAAKSLRSCVRPHRRQPTEGQGIKSSFRQQGTKDSCQQACLKSDPTVPVKPSDDCSPT